MANVTVEDLGVCKRRMNVEIDTETVLSKIEQVYGNLKKTAKIPGFRVGKVPRNILERHFKNDVIEEIKQELISESYQSSVKDNNLRPVHSPKIDNIICEENKPLSYTAEFEVEPIFELKSYDGIKVKLNKVKVDDQDVEDYLLRLREDRAILENVDNRSVLKNDYLFVDYKITAQNGEVVEQGNSKMLYMKDNDENGDGTIIGEVINQLEGMKLNEAKNIETTLPKNYIKKEYADLTVNANIKVTAIKQKVLPEITDEFAKSLGKFQTVGELREEIKKMIESQKKSVQKREGKQQIIDYFVEKYKFDLPQSVVDAEIQDLIRNMARSRYDAKPDYDKLKEKAKIDAVDKVKLSYVLAAIAKKENIKVEKQDLEQAIKDTAQFLNISIDKFKEHLAETGAIYGMQERILEEKVLDFLYNKAKIIEK
ncbi:trigger factor [bacterium]|nr:trigger factor [bacterium]